MSGTVSSQRPATTAYAMRETPESVQAVARTISSAWKRPCKVGIVLGTGLGSLASQVDVEAAFEYRDLPGFPRTTALSHRGQLICGQLDSIPVLVFNGRCHLYEGHALQDVCRPIELMAALNIRCLIISNASGGLNPKFRSGDVMVIEDHLDLQFRSPTGPLAGARQTMPQRTTTGVPSRPHAPDTDFYSLDLIERTHEVARRTGLSIWQGVYAGLTGPNYETRSEYRMLRRIGADAVGMSTVAEVSLARRYGMSVLAFSAITNVARPDAPSIVTAEDVVDFAALAEPKMSRLVRGLLPELANEV